LEGNGGSAVGGAFVKLRESVIRNNVGSGVVNDGRTRIRDTLIEGNGLRGVFGYNGASNLKIVNSTITGNSGHGIRVGGKVRIIDSAVTGNATSQAACDAPPWNDGAPNPCTDIYTLTVDQLGGVGITCGSSYVVETAGPSGFCVGE
jgi:hypothetical protein